jgi:hypothetical protein
LFFSRSEIADKVFVVHKNSLSWSNFPFGNSIPAGTSDKK